MSNWQDPEDVRRRGRLLAGAFRQSEWIQASATPAAGIPGSIAAHLLKGLTVVWRRWGHSSHETECRVVWRSVMAFAVGILSGWLLTTESSHLPIALATAALALAMTVGILG